MELRFSRRGLVRRHALQIARGRFGTTENLFVTVAHDGLTGLGEAAAVDHGSQVQDAASSETALRGLEAILAPVEPGRVHRLEQLAREAGVGSAARAALDIACWDWLAKRAGLPLHRLLGLDAAQPPTSVTVGIEAPERVAELARLRLSQSGARVLKLKLGGAGGIEADRARYEAAREAADGFASASAREEADRARYQAARETADSRARDESGQSKDAAAHEATGRAPIALRVDANGGWSPDDAVAMIAWLAERGCEYVEQPLAADAPESDLAFVHARRRLPVLLDEPIFEATDVARLAPFCDGINVKLMKSGGLSEAIRAIQTARAHGLKTMLGCFGESSVSIGAAASVGALLDYVDLDSHLNLDPDPAEGPALVDGRLVPPDRPGHGARLRDHHES